MKTRMLLRFKTFLSFKTPSRQLAQDPTEGERNIGNRFRRSGIEEFARQP